MANGVEVNGKKLRVSFNFEGARCREPLGLLDTEANRAYAANMVQQIRADIEAGLFNYARWFPNSRRLNEHRLGHWLDTWLDIKRQRVAASTYRGYKDKVETHLRPRFGDDQVPEIDRVMIETWTTVDLDHLASKTIKEVVAILRQVCALYRSRYPSLPNPTDGIKIKLPDDIDPDPFTREEISLILNTTTRGDRAQELNLVKFLMWSGPRVSEVLPFAWEDVIDLDRGLVSFRRARVNSLFKSTKTKRSTREHELLQPAREALIAQYKLTGHLPPTTVEVMGRDNRTPKKERLRFVFMNSNTGKPMLTDKNLRDRFFKAHLKKAGVRYRGPGQCRHTYISQMLTIDMPVEWISKQTGTSAEMIRRRYGKWINQDATHVIDAANAKLGFNITQNQP